MVRTMGVGLKYMCCVDLEKYYGWEGILVH